MIALEYQIIAMKVYNKSKIMSHEGFHNNIKNDPI